MAFGTPIGEILSVWSIGGTGIRIVTDGGNLRNRSKRMFGSEVLRRIHI